MAFHLIGDVPDGEESARQAKSQSPASIALKLQLVRAPETTTVPEVPAPRTVKKNRIEKARCLLVPRTSLNVKPQNRRKSGDL